MRKFRRFDCTADSNGSRGLIEKRYPDSLARKCRGMPKREGERGRVTTQRVLIETTLFRKEKSDEGCKRRGTLGRGGGARGKTPRAFLQFKWKITSAGYVNIADNPITIQSRTCIRFYLFLFVTRRYFHAVDVS